MSGVEKILEKILDDAGKEAASVIAEAEAKAADIKSKAAAAADRKAAAVIDAAKAEAEEIKKRRQSVCDLEQRKTVLAAKREVIEKAFAEAEKQILGADDAKYKAIMVRMLVECAETGDGTVVPAAADKDRIDAALVKQAADALAAKGVQRKIAISDKAAAGIKNGFVYTTEGMEFNCSFEAVLRQLRHDTETEVSRILFSE